MVIANDTRNSGLHTDPLHLKYAAATKLALTVRLMENHAIFSFSNLTSLTE
jgi:hypothetical protein